MPVPRPCGIAPGSARGRGHRLPPEPGHTVGRGGGRGEPRVHLSEGKEQWNARSAGQLRYHDAKKQLQVSKKTKHAAKGWVSLSPLPFPNSNTKTEENPEQSAVWIQEPKQERNRRTQPQEPSKVTICALVQRSTLITGQTVNTFKAGLLVTVKIKNNNNNKKSHTWLSHGCPHPQHHHARAWCPRAPHISPSQAGVYGAGQRGRTEPRLWGRWNGIPRGMPRSTAGCPRGSVLAQLGIRRQPGPGTAALNHKQADKSHRASSQEGPSGGRARGETPPPPSDHFMEGHKAN